MNATHYTLFQLNALVRNCIESSLPDEYWVEAELSEVRESRGHCYMELIEKSSDGNTPVAKASAKCWRTQWAMLRPHFERVAGCPLHAGLKVLLRVYPQFHENFGFSWIITDIDPSYTMGDMARKRQEIVRILKDEGVFDLNKQLPLPLFAQRIAVVSSQTAAGYGDFCNQLADNGYGFHFTTRLFPAVMQGENIEQSIIAALDAINAEADDFDAVVIIRGGGATSDLSGFDTLALAENVANFPLPVITGIGHDRDESVLDMVSHTRVKTPTAAAAFLVDHLAEVYGRVENASQQLATLVNRKLQTEHLRLAPLSAHIVSAARLTLASGRHRLDMLQQSLQPSANRRIQTERQHLELLAEKAKVLDPSLLLARGYSITLVDGKVLKDCAQVDKGTVIETRLAKGTLYSKVTIKQK